MYTTAFDVAQNGFHEWWPLLFAVVFALIPLGIYAQDPKAKGARIRKWFTIAVSVLGAAQCLGMFLALYGEWSREAHELLAGRYTVVEGPVTHFHPMPKAEHDVESFDVGNAHFQYTNSWGSSVFYSHSNTGFIHEGAQVKIFYNAGKILRIEVKQPERAAAI
jgi:hypothetical protein